MEMCYSNPSFGKFSFTLNSRGEQYTLQLKGEIGGLLIIAHTIGEVITIKTNLCTTEHNTLIINSLVSKNNGCEKLLYFIGKE